MIKLWKRANRGEREINGVGFVEWQEMEQPWSGDHMQAIASEWDVKDV